MTDDRRPSDLEDLDAKLRAAQGRHGGEPDRAGFASDKSGLSIAFRIGVELVAALAIGVAIGWLLDRWLGSSPWLLIVFFVLGAAAGIMNVIRVAKGYGGSVGYRKTGPGAAGEDRKD
ncbi:MAG TPA: AtpZ/AtpI family protein [Alphaproteobacteria bacterium]|jgi:ATP synthase protein I|nr:AtpZ/AtpI family protein [Alphaproteobacteria bacterium]